MSGIDFSKIVISDGGVVPTGPYKGRFLGPEHLPETDGDPMTGRGRRKYAKIRFSWEITSDGPYKGKRITVDTPVPQTWSAKSQFSQVSGWLTGRPPGPGETLDIMSCVGKEYGLIYAANKNKWVEVIHAMPTPV